MIIRYSPEIVNKYPGLEFFNPDSAKGGLVIPIKSILEVVSRDFVAAKYDSVEQDGLESNLGPLHGTNEDQGIMIRDGFHKGIFIYFMRGKNAHYVFWDDGINIEDVTENDSIVAEAFFEGIIQSQPDLKKLAEVCRALKQ